MCNRSRNPFSNQVNSLREYQTDESVDLIVVIPSQIRSIHSMTLRLKNGSEALVS